MPTQRFRSGGGWGVRLDESHMSYWVVRKTDDGRLIEACTVGETAAQRLIDLGGPVAVSRKENVQ
jgi:hypothetical protein